MEFVVSLIVLGAVVCLVLWIVHKQTLQSKDLHAFAMQRQQFNFENQWKLWIQDRESSNKTINNLAGWNAKLCDSHEKMGQHLQNMLKGVERNVSLVLAEKLDRGLAAIVEAVGKKPG